MTRELTVDLFCTVDGWLRGSNSPAYFGFDGPDLQTWIEEQVTQPYVMLMGSNTYKALLGYAVEGDGASKRMDDRPKVVFSKSLREPLEWRNTTLVAEELEVAVPKMKTEAGDPMRVIGSPSLVRSLLRLGLVDRLRLMVFPQVLGETGVERLLDGAPDINLRLASAKVLDGRLVLLEYAKA